MTRFRPSIASLVGLIAALGIGLAALRGADAYWHLAMILLALAALLTGILGSFLKRGHARAFWIGFTLFGWSFFGMLTNPHILGDPFDIEGGLDSFTYPSGTFFQPQLLREHGLNHPLLGWFRDIFFLELDLLFALAGGFIGRALAAQAGPAARDGEPPDPRRTS